MKVLEELAPTTARAIHKRMVEQKMIGDTPLGLMAVRKAIIRLQKVRAVKVDLTARVMDVLTETGWVSTESLITINNEKKYIFKGDSNGN